MSDEAIAEAQGEGDIVREVANIPPEMALPPVKMVALGALALFVVWKAFK